MNKLRKLLTIALLTAGILLFSRKTFAADSALGQRHNELTSIPPVAVRVLRHPPNRSVERCHSAKSIC